MRVILRLVASVLLIPSLSYAQGVEDGSSAQGVEDGSSAQGVEDGSNAQGVEDGSSVGDVEDIQAPQPTPAVRSMDGSKRIVFGPRADFVLSTFGNQSPDTPAVRVNRPGFAAGAFASIQLYKWLRLQPEVFYMTKGANVELDDERIGQLPLAYLEVPVLVRLEVPVHQRVWVNAMAGPALSFLLSARNKDEIGNDIDIKDQLESLDWGLLAGVGVALSITPSLDVVFDGRYEQALMSFVPDGEGTPWKNRTLAFGLGVRWGPGR